MSIEYFGLFIALISFLGFLVENLWLAIRKGYIDNRNFCLPFLLGYGLMVTGFALCFGTPDNVLIFGIKTNLTGRLSWVIYFLKAFIVVCAGEHILGTAVKKLCGFDYWNYDDLPLKLSKYTTIPTSIAFALMITVFMGYCVRPIAELFMAIDINIAKVLSDILIFILFIDYFFSFKKMIKTRHLNVLWKIYLQREKNLKNSNVI